MKILIIGATGQIGYALAQTLLDAGHEIRVMVRSSSQVRFSERVQMQRADVFTQTEFAQALVGQDAVVYSLGLPEQFTFDRRIFDRVNLGLLQTFTAALAQSSVRRWMYMSTYEVFAAQQNLITETHRVSDPATLSPYFSAMTRAFVHAKTFAQSHQVQLTTVHPAAVYGGLNTSEGITNVLENLLNWRWWKLPVILPSAFPVVHVHSLVQAIVSALPHPGHFIVSDGMTSLRQLATTLRQQTPSYRPLQVPAMLAYAGIVPLEAVVRLLRFKPLLCKAQLDFITLGNEPLATHAMQTLDWQPLSLSKGIARYLTARTALLDVKGD